MRQQAGNIRGQGFSQTVRQAIEQYGETITLPDGSPAPASVTSLDASRVGQFFPLSFVNAGASDPLLVDVPKTYITDPSLETKRITRQGISYTILRVLAEALSNEVAIYRLIVYRTPVEGASADDAEQLTEFEYVPPVP